MTSRTSPPPVPRTPEQLRRFHEWHERVSRELVDNLNRNVLADHPPSSRTCSMIASGVGCPCSFGIKSRTRA